MASDTKNASESSTGEGRACGSSAPAQDGQHVSDKSGSDCTQPRAGRTGKVGAKAERPADGRLPKGDGAEEPPRSGKAPSPAARDGDAPGEPLPLPARDSNG